MKVADDLLQRIYSDLGIGAAFIKGRDKVVKRCWHFSTDGNSIDYFFKNEADFVAGMNRIILAVNHYDVVILSFVLMDTHVHFVLWGEYDECNRFIHEYVRRTSFYMAAVEFAPMDFKRSLPFPD